MGGNASMRLFVSYTLALLKDTVVTITILCLLFSGEGNGGADEPAHSGYHLCLK